MCMWELDHKGSWMPKNWCFLIFCQHFFWTVVLEKTVESPLDCKEIKLVNPKENQFWIFIGKTDAEAAGLIRRADSLGKNPDAGKGWRQKEKEMTENEMVGWPHRLNGHEFEQAWGDGEGQESLAYCSPWGHKQTWLSDWTTTTRSWKRWGDRLFPGVFRKTQTLTLAWWKWFQPSDLQNYREWVCVVLVP